MNDYYGRDPMAGFRTMPQNQYGGGSSYTPPIMSGMDNALLPPGYVSPSVTAGMGQYTGTSMLDPQSGFTLPSLTGNNILGGVNADLPSYALPNVMADGGLAATPNAGGIKWLNDRDGQGVAGLALSGAMGLANTILGFQQYGLAKDQLRASKDQFERNYAAQRNLTNSRLEDRQRARLGSSGGTNASYESVGDYMNKYGVK